MIQALNLRKQYGSVKALDNLCLEIEDSHIFGFVGPNGAGKTTAMKIMAGLLYPDGGQIFINGKDALSDRKLLKEEIGYMPDFFGVYDNLKVEEYLDFYAGTYYIPYRDRPELIGSLLELVGLTGKKDSYVDGLSRGMKQRLCLARSLIHDPKLLILDEPASGLDPRARVDMKEILKHLRTLNKTIIISSHILSEMTEMCSKIGIIDGGRMVVSGAVSDVMKAVEGNKKVSLKAMSMLDESASVLAQHTTVSDITLNIDDIKFTFDGNDEELARILKELVLKGVPVISFKEEQGSLEDVFMNLTNGGGI